MRTPKLIPLALLLLAAAALSAACGESPARKAGREQARRTSCVAAELALTAKERLAGLDTQLVVVQGGPFEQVTAASRQFAAAYQDYANAYSQSADLADSAAYAGESRDSARYAQEAERTRPAIPQAGTVPGNAYARFTSDMEAALANPDHPCNHPDQPKDGDG
jgi:hypothetical protein